MRASRIPLSSIVALAVTVACGRSDKGTKTPEPPVVAQSTVAEPEVEVQAPVEPVLVTAPGEPAEPEPDENGVVALPVEEDDDGDEFGFADASDADVDVPDVPAPGSDDLPSGPVDPSMVSAAAAMLVDVEGANIRMQQVEVNGLRLMGLACAAESAPLLGSAVLVGSIGNQKKALNKCAKRGGAAVVHWTAGKRGASAVKVTGQKSGKTRACIAKAMKKVRAPFSGKCGVVVLVGGETGADASLAKLLAAPQTRRPGH